MRGADRQQSSMFSLPRASSPGCSCTPAETVPTQQTTTTTTLTCPAGQDASERWDVRVSDHHVGVTTTCSLGASLARQ
jgi:hypothetical protein